LRRGEGREKGHEGKIRSRRLLHRRERASRPDDHCPRFSYRDPGEEKGGGEGSQSGNTVVQERLKKSSREKKQRKEEENIYITFSTGREEKGGKRENEEADRLCNCRDHRRAWWPGGSKQRRMRRK